MSEGNIIKFYREKAKLTQKELGIGICSVTHLSKIERGLTEYSGETIQHIVERLGIDMDRELAKLDEIKELLDHWHEVMMKEGLHEVEVIKKELENAPLIHISAYKHFYRLLQIRYELIHYNLEKAQDIIDDVQKIECQLSNFEKNLLKQILGMYYIAKNDHVKAIDTLKTIKENEYNHPEYYYYLAVAYHNLNSEVMCYHYAEKALRHFKRNNNFLKVIDTEKLMLVQLLYDQHHDSQHTIKQHEALIESCVTCNAVSRQGKLIHNLALFYHIRRNYKKASELYKKSCSLSKEKSHHYLLSLKGYIRSSFEGELLSKNQLIQFVHKGIRIAKEIENDFLITLFNLQFYLIKEQEEQYHQYLATEGLPYFKKIGYEFLIQRSEKELFQYYYKKNEMEMALEIAYHSFNKEDVDMKSY